MTAPKNVRPKFLALAALGVVFGDIGTSPLYTYEIALSRVPFPTPADAIGVASLILWSLLLLVAVKYAAIVMRADYHGEGGVFALFSLLLGGKEPTRKRLPLVAMLLLFGAALLYGDGTITPAISVLSAIEGLEAINPRLAPYVLPTTVAILAALFGAQKLGAGRLGRFFGPVMLLWFVAIGALGLWWIARRPEALAAANPLFALRLLEKTGWHSMFLLGGVVLAVTGVEALYADMGHFGRRAIAQAWYGVALPCLALNYLGQAALAIERPDAFRGGLPFFLMVPPGAARVALVALATAATIIASQALISGVFSLTAQARELGFIPKVRVIHTSDNERGQVFVPSVNAILGGACALLVLTFQSSENLAAAYGLAVIGTMSITTLATTLVARRIWKWKLWQAGLFCGGFLAIEGAFLVSSLNKIGDGGYFPLFVAGALMAVMLTWHRGRQIIQQTIRRRMRPAEQMLSSISERQALPGQLVLVTNQDISERAFARMDEMLRQGVSPRKRTIVLSLVSSMQAAVDTKSSVEASPLAPNIWRVTARHGYMQEPNAPGILARAALITDGAISSGDKDTFFVLPRELIIEYAGASFSRWRRSLFGILSRTQSYAPDYYHIPHDQIFEFTWMIRA